MDTRAADLLTDHNAGTTGGRTSLGSRASVFLAALALLVLLPGFHVSLFDRDEGWYAQVCREMVESGDWLVPRYLGEIWLAKPPLTYWLVAASYRWLGVGEWQARLVPVLAMSLNVVLVASLGAQMIGRRAGVLAGTLFITACLPAIVGRMLLTDAVMLSCTLAAVTCHWMMTGNQGPRKTSGDADGEVGAAFAGSSSDCRRGAVRSSGPGQRHDSAIPHRLAAAYWLFIGLGILAKGPATLVFAGAFGLAMLATPGRRAWLWSGRYWAWLPLALAVAAPWYAYIARQAGGTFVQQFLGYEIAERIAGTPHGHGGPPGYYLLLSLAGLLPWTAFVPGTLIIVVRRRREDPTLWMLFIWMIVPWTILELIHSKLPHYILPCYVPLFVMLARTLDESLRTRRSWADVPAAERRVLNLWVRILIALGVLIVLSGAAALSSFVAKFQAPPGAGLAIMAVGCVLASGYALTSWLMHRRSLASAGLAAVVSMAAFHVTSGLWLFPSLEPARLSRNLALRMNAAATPAQRVYICGYEEPSTFFYLRQPARPITPDELADLARSASVTALVALTQRAWDRLPVETAEQLKPWVLPEPVTGFNYVKMSQETIWLLNLSPR